MTSYKDVITEAEISECLGAKAEAEAVVEVEREAEAEPQQEVEEKVEPQPQPEPEPEPEQETLHSIEQALKLKGILPDNILNDPQLQQLQQYIDQDIESLKTKEMTSFDFNWSKFEQSYSFILDDYINGVKQLMMKMDHLQHQKRVWNELFLTLDHRRCFER